MHGYIERSLEKELSKKINNSPVVAILGPRQCGKTTLAKKIISDLPSVYLDLQNRTDLNKLNEPEIFLETYSDKLICLDEIQLKPDFFNYLRSEIDKDRRNGRFLILGSASRDLIKQSSESLAGRISYTDLSSFMFEEVNGKCSWQELMLKGGFPESLLAEDDEISFEWRIDFIRTFLERDIPSLGFNIPIPIIEKLWILLSHYHGQTLNYSKLANTVDVTQQTLKKYLAILEQTYMIRFLIPFEANIKKRLVRSPKVYIRDSGILNALQNIEKFDELLANPISGQVWEGLCIENLIFKYKKHKAYFLKTSNGAEVDLILEKAGKLTVYEFKFSKAPKPSRGFYEIIKDLGLENQENYIIAPVDEKYEYKKNIWIKNLGEI